MLSLVDWITIISGVVAIVGAVVGVTVYTTRLLLTMGEKSLREDKEQLEQKLAILELRYKESMSQIETIQKTGSASLVKKVQIDTEVTTAKNYLNVTACSVLVPYPLSGKKEFIFLSVDSEAADRLKKTRIPLDVGIAGYVYATGNPYTTVEAQKDVKFFNKADSRSGFKTENMLCLPLMHDNKPIGVIQFINKSGGGQFNEMDLTLAERIIQNLSPKVYDFCQDPDNFDILGLGSEKPEKDATIIVCDLSNSSALTSSLPMSIVEDLFNEYLEKIVEIGFKYGGTIDKFLGDGLIMHFNVSRPINNHAVTAVRAAIEMIQEFAALRDSWEKYGFPASKLFNRISIESGPIFEVMLGHPQYRHLTLIGECLIRASYLSTSADRDRDIIIIGPDAHKRLGNLFNTKSVPIEKLGKARALISIAYEITVAQKVM